MSRGCGLTSDCIFSSAWQRESREGQTDKGRQSGGQRGTDRGMHRAPHTPTRTPQPCTRKRSMEAALTEE